MLDLLLLEEMVICYLPRQFIAETFFLNQTFEMPVVLQSIFSIENLIFNVLVKRILSRSLFCQRMPNAGFVNLCIHTFNRPHQDLGD